MKIFIKKVPDNEIGSGTEIAILKTYFDNNLIDDPKDFIGSEVNHTQLKLNLITIIIHI